MKTEFAIVLLLSILSGWAVESKDIFVAAPNVFRLDVVENIALAINGAEKSETLDVYIQDHPKKKRTFASVTVVVSPGIPEIANLTIKSEDLEEQGLKDLNKKFYVCLVAHGVEFHKEVIIPLLIQAGYMFLQTDKPIYVPKQKVQFRIIPLDEEMKPTHIEIRLQIRNPRNLVVRDTLHNNKQRSRVFFITPHPFSIAAQPILGKWSATVLYGYKFQQNTTVLFEVAEYVLPTFTVRLEHKEIILPNAKIIPITVRAKYLYGKPVMGTATIRFGIKGQAPQITYFGIVNSKKLSDGMYTFNLDTNLLKRHDHIKWFPHIEGFRLIVEATVIDYATGLKETAVNSNAIFSSSPPIISFKRSSRYFKPGLKSVIEADLTYVSGRPAFGIKTVLTGTGNRNLPLRVYTSESVSDDKGRIWFEIHSEIHHTFINVVVKTEDPEYSDNQAVGHHVLNKFISKGNAYIAINRRTTGAVQPGTLFSENIYIESTGPPITDLYFLVTSRGRIIMIQKLPQGQFKALKVEFQVTHKMAPSFRITVFSHYSGELIADSLKVDVINACDPKGKVEIVPYFPDPSPGSVGRFSFKGSKGTLVGILAVNSGVHVLSDEGLLTKSKMLDALANRDLGCHGGGMTTDEVLRNAGLVMLSTYHSSPWASESSCEVNRKKREAASVKPDDWHDRFRYCCALGMQDDGHGKTCIQRLVLAKMHMKEEVEECSKIFLDCCPYNISSAILMNGASGLESMAPNQSVASNLQKSSSKANREKREAVSVDIVEPELEEELELGVDTRKELRETWIFTETMIGPDGEVMYDVSIPHSITTWWIQAVSISPNSGICVIDPIEFKVTSNMFVQLNLPYSVVRNEQIEVQATVFNYRSRNIVASVYMYDEKDICSDISEGEKSERKLVYVDAYSAQSVSFLSSPLKEGNFNIKVSAFTIEGSDVVIGTLNVVPEGYPFEQDVLLNLDPSNRKNRLKTSIVSSIYFDAIDENTKTQITSIKLNVPEDAVPGTESCVVSIIGSNFAPTAVETRVENLESILSGPNGNAEQNMIHFASTMYAIRYLKSTGKLSAEIEMEGLGFILLGYYHQLKFRKEDGSFGAYVSTPSSVWLTAFVIRAFCDASKFFDVDSSVTCQGIAWLVSKQNSDDGSFIEDNPVTYTKIMGEAVGKGSLTAYVLLTLEACQCDIDTAISKARAVEYLESILSTVEGPSTTALVAYALAIFNSKMKYLANDKVLSYGKFSSDIHTLERGGSVEATSYALLSQLRLNKMSKINAFVSWLNLQKLSSTKFQSPQATIVGVYALSEYAIRMSTVGLTSKLTSSNDRHFDKTVTFDKNNAHILQQIHVNKLGGTLFINTTGDGTCTLSVNLRYNLPKPPEELCKFDVTADVSEADEKHVSTRVGRDLEKLFLPDDLIKEKRFLESPEKIRAKRADNDKLLNIKICVKYLGDDEPEMSIVDAGIFAGFKLIKTDLTQLINSRDSPIDRYEVWGRGVMFYLRQVPHTEPYCFSFKIRREFIVDYTQTSVIKTYDYYNQEKSCTIFYNSFNKSPLLLKICGDESCQCGQGGCPKKDPFINHSRADLSNACEQHDYVWKVEITKVERMHEFINITARVLDIFKPGIETPVEIEGETRTFLAKETCESAVLVLGQEYMIMGKDGQKYSTENGEIKYRYLFDRHSKIQIWMTLKDARERGSVSVQRNLLWASREWKEDGCLL